MNRVAEVSGFFKVKAQVIENAGARNYVFPTGLESVRYGVMAINPDDRSEILISASGTVEQLQAFANMPGITPLNNAEAERLYRDWSTRP